MFFQVILDEFTKNFYSIFVRYIVFINNFDNVVNNSPYKRLQFQYQVLAVEALFLKDSPAWKRIILSPAVELQGL